MYRLNFFIEIRVSGDSARVLKKAIELPFVPYFGLNIETEFITLELNRLGYSLKDEAFFTILEEQNIEIDDVADTVEYWQKSGFEESDIAAFKRKEATVG